MTNAANATRSITAEPLDALALAPDGRWALVHGAHGVARVDLANGEATSLCAEAVACAAFATEAWIVVDEGARRHLLRFDRDGGAIAGRELPALGGSLRVAAARDGVPALLVEGTRAALALHRDDDGVAQLAMPTVAGRRVALAPRTFIEQREHTLVLSRPGWAQPLAVDGAALIGRALVGGSALLGGELAALELCGATSGAQLVVINVRTGTLRAQLRLTKARAVAYAERAGVALVALAGGEVLRVDLRSAQVSPCLTLEGEVGALAVDAEARRLVYLVDGPEGPVLAKRALPQPSDGSVAAAAPADDDVAAPLPCAAADGRSSSRDDDEAADAAAGEPATVERGDFEPAIADAGDGATRASAAALVLDEPLRALRPLDSATLDAAELRAWHDDLFAVAAAHVRCALALALDRGSWATREDPPMAEIERLLDRACGRAPDLLAAARARLAQAEALLARWRGRATPLDVLAAELDLSPLASRVLMLAAAPRLFIDLGRAYARVSGGREPVVDEALLLQLLSADGLIPAEIAHALDAGAPLRRAGAVELADAPRPFAAIGVHPMVLRRLQGLRPERIDAGHLRLRDADRTLDELRVPRAPLAALVRALTARATSAPVRVVLRGRAGSGRRTVAATLAACAGRRLACIEPTARDAALASELRAGLCEALLAGHLPCVGVESAALDPAALEEVCAVLERHPGPLLVRAAVGAPLPVGAGHLELVLPVLGEAERADAWVAALRERGLPTAPAAELARRYSVGPGTMVRAAAAVEAAGAPGGDDELQAALERALRQQRDGRISRLAGRVEHLARFEDLVVSDEVAARLNELVVRVQQRRRVLDEWGMARVVGDARGVIALFAGGPGTGKTLAAGAIARALGYELWRVDLSRVLSKWIGETERNLAAVFDAAEDGDVLLLFDEADALFGKRTTVDSSHDRYANLEVDYLLQRVDSFSGLAILTTNFGSALDAAFKRRLSCHVQFEFPDESERARLWRAHLPATLAQAGDIDVTRLAQRFAVSGGVVRNVAIRAAYLAAAAGTAMAEEHLLRALEAEYHDRGKLTAVGTLE